MIDIYEINSSNKNLFDAMKVDAGKKILIITKNTEYKDFIVQEGLKSLNELFNTSVLSIDEFYLRNSCGSYKFLSDMSMRLIIKKVIDMNKDVMPFLKYPSYMDLIFETIKQAYAKGIDLISNGAEYKKIYSDYNNILKQKGYLALNETEELDEIKLKRADEIYFIGFNEINKKLVYLVELTEKLSKSAKIFIEKDFVSEEFLSYLKNISQNYHTSSDNIGKFEKIAKKLFSEEIFETDGIEFVRADSVEAELDYALTDIKRSVLNGPYDFKGVLIYLMDKSEEQALVEMLGAYDIPINKNKVLYLKDLPWQEKLYSDINEFSGEITKQNLIQLINNYASDEALLKKFKIILDTIEDIYGKNISKDDYIALLKLAFKYEVYRKKDRDPNGVSIYSSDFDTLKRYKLIYVIGMGMDNFPTRASANFLLASVYNEVNYDANEYMSELSKNLMKKIFNACDEKITISYSTSTKDDADQGASIFYNEFNISDKDSDKWVRVKSLNALEKNISLAANEEQKTFIAAYKGLVPKKYLDYDQINILRNSAALSKYNGKLETYTAMAKVDDFINNRLTVSFLESFNNCPFAALLSYIYEIEPSEVDMKARNIGSFMHKVLETYYRTFIGEKVIFDKNIFAKTINSIKNFNEYADVFNFEFENIESYIKDFIIFDQERMKNSNYIVKEVEKAISFNVDSYKIKGKIDRVDEDSLAKKLFLIDYKRSASTLKDNLQLSSYALYYKNIGYEIDAAFIGISKFSQKINIEKTDSLACEEKIKSIIAKLKTYNFPIISNLEKKLCPNYCPYKNMCKRGREWWSSTKNSS